MPKTSRYFNYFMYTYTIWLMDSCSAHYHTVTNESRIINNSGGEKSLLAEKIDASDRNMYHKKLYSTEPPLFFHPPLFIIASLSHRYPRYLLLSPTTILNPCYSLLPPPYTPATISYRHPTPLLASRCYLTQIPCTELRR